MRLINWKYCLPKRHFTSLILPGWRKSEPWYLYGCIARGFSTIRNHDQPYLPLQRSYYFHDHLSVSLYVSRITQILLFGMSLRKSEDWSWPNLAPLKFESDLDHHLDTKTKNPDFPFNYYYCVTWQRSVLPRCSLEWINFFKKWNRLGSRE